MKSSKLIMGCLATLGLTAGAASVQAQVDRDAIAERLAPVGEVCLQGEECGTAVAAASASGGSSGGVDGESIYGSVCMACHDTGAAGAPKRGDEAAWADRTAQGFETLLDHALNGFNAMPARGGNPNLSDEEVQAALAHLVEPVMEVPELGGGEAAAEEEAPAEAEEEVAAAEEDSSADDAATEEEATEAAEADSGLDGEALYASAPCAACHASGAAGAPVVGDVEAWAPRIDKGVEALYESAINGIGAMPPKGGATLPDEEVKAIVDYMVSQAQ